MFAFKDTRFECQSRDFRFFLLYPRRLYETIVKSSENNGINRRILSIFARFKSRRPLFHVPFQSSFLPIEFRDWYLQNNTRPNEGRRQLIRKKGDEQTGCSFLPLVDKSYEGAVNTRTPALHLVGKLRNIDGEKEVVVAHWGRHRRSVAANIVSE